MSCSSCGKLQTGDVGFTLQSGCFCSAENFTSPADVQGGLISKLTGCVDAIRDLKTKLGARQYEVSLIWTKWTGGRRGDGEEYVFKETVLMPTPKIGALTSVSKQLTEVGLAESGSLTVSEISAGYDEGTLLGMIDGHIPHADTNFYYEVRTPSRGSGCFDIRRRFFPSAAPDHSEVAFAWTVNLIRAHGDRTPAGLPRGVPSGLGATRGTIN